MKRKLYLILLFCGFTICSASAQKLEWLQDFGGNARGLGETSVSKAGITFVTGYFDSIITTADDSIKATYKGENFCGVLDSRTGIIKWIKPWYGHGNWYGKTEYIRICSDDSGNCYVFGTTTSDTFRVGETVLTHDSTNVLPNLWYFIIKFNIDGALQWAKKSQRVFIRNTTGDDAFTSLLISPGDNSLFIFTTQADHFDLEGKGISSAGAGRPLIMSKLSNEGKLLWSKYITEPEDTVANEYYGVSDGKSFYTVLGSKHVTIKGIKYTNAAISDYNIILKIDTSGDCQWVKQVNGAIAVNPGYGENLTFNSGIPLTILYTDNFSIDNHYLVANKQTANAIICALDTSGKITYVGCPAEVVDTPLWGCFDEWAGNFCVIYDGLNESHIVLYNQNLKRVLDFKADHQNEWGVGGIDHYLNRLLVGANGYQGSFLGKDINYTANQAFIASLSFNLPYLDSFHISSLNLYPNPVSKDGILKVHSLYGFNGMVQNTIYDMLGRRVGVFTISPSGYDYEIPVAHLAAQMYFLEVKIGSEKRLFRFVVE